MPKRKRSSKKGLSREQRDLFLRRIGFNSYDLYLQSALWASIRAKVLQRKKCVCGCGRPANQVHHRSYSEANLVGKTTKGLAAINGDCHYGIEFTGERKNSLCEANRKLRQRRLAASEGYSPESQKGNPGRQTDGKAGLR